MTTLRGGSKNTGALTSTLGWVRGLLDVGASGALLYLLSAARLGSFDLTPDYRILVMVSCVLIAAVYATARVYRPVPGLLRQLFLLLRGWALVIGALLFVGFVTQTSEFFSRPVLLAWFVVAPLLQVVNGVIARTVLPKILGARSVLRSVVVGSGPHAAELAATIGAERGVDEEVAGLVVIDSEGETSPSRQKIPVLGDPDSLAEIIAREHIRRVYLALPMEQAGTVRELYMELLGRHVDVVWAPDIFGVQVLNHGIDEIGGRPVIFLSATPLAGAAGVLKAILDRLGAALGLLLLAPLMLLISVLVRLSSEGPIYFRQKRRGFDGREFTVFKFRTMYVHEESSGKLTQASRNDSRITPIGRFLRRTSLDELPQLVNVLQGSMSLVGPRPHAVEHDEYYGARIGAYMLRHRIKPGLTGLAQVNGFRGETRAIEDMEGRIQYDLMYINNWSIWLDLRIILLTVFVAPFQRSAY